MTAPAPSVDVFFAFGEDMRSPALLQLVAELRREGRSVETDYAGRSLKGQLTQASRLNAGTTVIVGADEATIRRTGQEDEVIPLDDLAEGLRG